MIYSDYTRKGIKHGTTNVIIRLSIRKKKEIEPHTEAISKKSWSGTPPLITLFRRSNIATG
jgi:hypothetical protein